MAAGWTVDTIATMAALPFLDTSAIESLTGMPVRSQPRDPRSARRRSPGDSAAFMVAPATFNTINKLALGIADTYPLTVLAEAIGSRAPVVVVPFVNSALASRRPYQEALARLRSEGVRILEGEEDGWLPHPPGTGGQQQQSFPWRRALKAIAMP
jgi:phosphopantothenoylcysteine synthetase/decarboxylase